MKYFVFIIMVLLIIGMIYLSFIDTKEKNKEKAKKLQEKKNGPQALSQEDIDEIDPSLNKDMIIEDSFELYNKIFEISSKKQLKSISDYDGDNIINYLKDKLENNMENEYRTIRKDSKLLDGRIIGVYFDNKFEYVNIYLNIEEIKYDINIVTNEIKNKKQLKPRKSKISILLKREIDYITDTKCKKCKEEVHAYETLKCMNCNTPLIKDTKFIFEDYHENK